MIAFASLFLGLMVGVRPVTVIVGDAVAAVAFELDGRPAARVTAAPWTAEIDFGQEFEPHELVARAFDAKAQEVGFVRQWINLPRPPAEVEIVLERDANRKAVGAHLAWESILGVRPNRISVTFDGKALSLDGPYVTLPSYDPEATHVLTAVLDFPNGVRSRKDVVLGGGSAGDATSELTAVPILAEPGRPPSADRLRGRFRLKDQPLSVMAVERGAAEVVLVRETAPTEAAAALKRGRALGGALLLLSDPTGLEKEDRIQILWPIARRIVDAGTANELFETSREFAGKSATFRFLLTQVEYPGAVASRERFADAVAVAGLRACGSYSRRAVVLVLGSSGRDASRYPILPVRRYLERLRVPLFVWSLVPAPARPKEAADWGDVEDASSYPAFEQAVDRLRRNLDRQAIVWVDGHHLPQEIRLEGPEDGLALVR